MKEEYPYTQMIKDRIFTAVEKMGFSLDYSKFSIEFQAGFKAGKEEALKVIKELKI